MCRQRHLTVAGDRRLTVVDNPMIVVDVFSWRQPRHFFDRTRVPFR
jgi:hypothetical protein